MPPSMLYDEKPGDCLTWKNQGQNIEAVMQFTGIKDRAGKEIYEGDILHFRPKAEYFNAEVKWSQEYGCWIGSVHTPFFHSYKFNSCQGLTSGQCEVIGNIYETPNFLKPEEG